MDTAAAQAEEEEFTHLTDVEKEFKERVEKEGLPFTRVPTTALDPTASARVDQITIPEEKRGAMPYTKDQYLIRENPALVQWERETRKFLRKLSPVHGHRVAAVMVFEWATGLSIAALAAEEKRLRDAGQSTRGKTSWRADLRKINQILRHYFGKPYMTYIMGRKVPNCYRVPVGWHVYRHRPLTLTLFAERKAGVKL